MKKNIILSLMILVLVILVSINGFAKNDIVRYIVPRSIEVLDDAHVWAAKEMGYFNEEGIDVVFEQAYGTSTVKMIGQGQGEFSIPNPPTMLTSFSAGIPIISVFQVDRINIFGVAVLEDSPIKKWTDLVGKTVACTSATSYMNLNPILIEAGVDPNSVELIIAGPQRAQMLSEKKVDAAYTWEKEWQMWQAQGMDLRYLSGDEHVQNCANSICTSIDIYENDKDLVERFLRGYAKGLYFTKINPAAATQIVLEKFPSIKLTIDEALSSIEALVKITNDDDSTEYGYGFHNIDKWETHTFWAKELDIIREDLEIVYSEIFTNEFVDAANNFDHEKIEQDALNFKIN